MTFGDECNCGNCAKSPCEAIVSCSETIGNNKALENVFREAFAEFTAKTGCLSHPRAREVVMADVVEELNKELLHTKDIDNAKYLRHAIKLIRGGKE